MVPINQQLIKKPECCRQSLTLIRPSLMFLFSFMVSGQNLALGKPSLQSSTLWNYEPGLAVDDDPDSCSFTPRSTDQRWWQVHLGDAVTIQSVAVTISPGSYQHFTIFVIGWFHRTIHLNDQCTPPPFAELLEGNKAMYKPCSKFEGKFEEKKAVFLCNDGDGHPGQFVYIRDDREEQEYFGLCEVEVFQFQSEFLLVSGRGQCCSAILFHLATRRGDLDRDQS